MTETDSSDRRGHASHADPFSFLRTTALQTSGVVALGVEIVAGVLLVFATTFVVLQVLFRYILGSPLEWTEEAARYTAVYAGLLGASLGVRSNPHFRILYVVNYLSGRKQRLVYMAVRGVMAFTLVVIAWKGLLFAADTGIAQLSPGLRISMAWLYSSVPTTAVLMLLFMTCEAIAGEVKPIFTEEKASEMELAEKIALEAEQAGGIASAGTRRSEGHK